jgi:hypothetical protein
MSVALPEEVLFRTELKPVSLTIPDPPNQGSFHGKMPRSGQAFLKPVKSWIVAKAKKSWTMLKTPTIRMPCICIPTLNQVHRQREGTVLTQMPTNNVFVMASKQKLETASIRRRSPG